LVNAGDVGSRPPHEIVQTEAHFAAHKPVDRQRPIVSVDARHTEMTEHDRYLGVRDTINQLMGLKRVTTVGGGRIELDAKHSETPSRDKAGLNLLRTPPA
jgi:hypothetical protein